MAKAATKYVNITLYTLMNEYITRLVRRIFCCLGVYGDVQRVKILYNKKDSALIQMAEPHQAHLGMYSISLLVMSGQF